MNHDSPAIACMRAAATPAGFVASPVERSNYQRVWARDSMVCGLAAALCGDSALMDALGASLQTLSENRGRQGLLPSNVAVDGKTPPSYGGLAGRVDAGAWFIIGACHYLSERPEDPRRPLFEDTIRGCLSLYESWELNARGLLNVPMGGCWADEYPLHGYTLTEQLLRIWAMRLAAERFADASLAERTAKIQDMVERSFFIQKNTDASATYHPLAYERLREAGAPTHWMASLSPGGYQTVFDALANALAVILGLGDAESRAACLGHGAAIAHDLGGSMVPAFWPPIADGDALWPDLLALCAHGFRNHPGEYHNGGLWPMVNGFWGLALVIEGRREAATALLEEMRQANARRESVDGPCFFEFHVADSDIPRGTPSCTWSAAGELILSQALAGRALMTGETSAKGRA